MTRPEPSPQDVMPSDRSAVEQPDLEGASDRTRAWRFLYGGMILFVSVQSLYIGPELLAWLTQAPEAVPGQRTTTLLMQGGSICGTLSLIALPTFPFTSRHTRLRLWIGSVLFGASMLLGTMYLMR